jgi:hypothetical protein
VLDSNDTLLFLQKDELITFPSAPPSTRILAGRPLTAPMKVRRRRAFLCLLSWEALNDWSLSALRRRRRSAFLLMGGARESEVMGVEGGRTGTGEGDGEGNEE